MAPTLIPPPPDNKNKAPIENVLQLTSLAAIEPDLFTNTRPLWHPPGARGIYGGAAIAQCLAAAQLTIPPPSEANGFAKFYVHSMHCYFVLAGNSEIPVVYSVERVREGKSFMTRTVQARQEGRCIFTTTLSFVREGSSGAQTVDHAADLPPGAREALEKILAEEKRLATQDASNTAVDNEGSGPYERRPLPLLNGESERAFPSEEQQQQEEEAEQARADQEREQEEAEDERKWGEHGILLPATPGSIGYGPWTKEPVETSYHDGDQLDMLWRRDVVHATNASRNRADSDRPEEKRTQSWIRARGTISPSAGHEPHLAALAYISDSWFIGTVSRVNNLWRWSSPDKKAWKKGEDSKGQQEQEQKPKPIPEFATDIAKQEVVDNQASKLPPRKIGMIVSLDHTIFFHRPQLIKADDWMFQEMESPWSGDGRGLVLQRIWNRQGQLLATCVQEGLVRLQQQQPAQSKI